MSNPMHTNCDVAVIGAGVIGLTIAWRAAACGLRVVVLDAGQPGHGTSHVAAGMLAPVSEALATERPLLALSLSSAKRYAAFVEQLAADSGADPGYRRAGTLLIARDGDEAEALERELALRIELGLSAERLLGSEARKLEPGLAQVRLALHAEQDRSVDPRRLCAALSAAVTAAGGELRAGSEVVEMVAAPGAATVLTRSGERLQAGAVVLAAGFASARIAGPPARAADWLRPVKGQILRLHDPAGPGLAERVLRLSDGYIVPRGDGRYVIGATMEERGFDTTVTAGGVYELLRSATEVLPGVSELVLDEAAAGLRPGTRDNAPLIGRDREAGVLVWATGHHRHGVLLAPATAELVLAELLGEPLPDDLAPLAASFDPERFAGERGWVVAR